MSAVPSDDCERDLLELAELSLVQLGDNISLEVGDVETLASPQHPLYALLLVSIIHIRVIKSVYSL